ncbi:MAG TPA: biopolymer transporter ExbD [Thermoanaerobaculia bacterium]
MAISMGSSGESGISDINMTPMIDVLLVLLVIFMIAQPLLQQTIDVQVPKERPDQTQVDESQKIVLEIQPGGVYLINTQQVEPRNLQSRLTEIYSARPDKILFVKAAPEIVYQDVIAAMDAARGAGVEVLGAVME